MKEHTRRRFAGLSLRLSAIVSSASVIVAVAACDKGSSESPPAPASSSGKAGSPPGPAGSAGRPSPSVADQFDSGSYDVRKDNVLVATLFANLDTDKETWVLSKSACKLADHSSYCDISGAQITQRAGDSCGGWIKYAEDKIKADDRVVYNAAYTSAPLACAPNCSYNQSGGALSGFSMFPAGYYTQDGASPIHVAVQPSGNALVESWFMGALIGQGGAKLAPVGKDPVNISSFACGACGKNMQQVSVLQVTYTLNTGTEIKCP